MAMRSMLNTVLRLGLVEVPIKVYAATGSHDRTLNQYHRSDAGRIRYERVCELDDEAVPSDEIVKGAEAADGAVVLLRDADFDALPSGLKLVDVRAFVPGDQIDPIHYERTYYLGPGADGAEPYAVLREALRASGRVGIATVTIRQRESLAALRPHGDVLVLETMLWADEIVLPDKLDAGVGIEPAEEEMALARLLIDAKTGSWDPGRYRDDYQEALGDLIEAKAAGRPAPKAEPTPAPETGDLMAALQQSVEAAGVTVPTPPAAKKAAKKRAKKATARKTATTTGTAQAAARRRRT
jgi:DNA end-binding protein Ku